MIRILIKNRFRALFGSAVGKTRKGKEIKKASTLKIVLFSILYLYLAVVLIGVSVGFSYLLSKFLLPGADWLYYLVFMAISITLVFILGIFETKTELFECKDNDLLLSMPIKPRDIVAARIIIVLIINYVINAIVIIPALIFYAVFAKNFLGIIGGILVFLFLPVFSTALASFVGYLVAEISRKIKFKNLVTVILTLVLLAIYFWVVEILSSNIEQVLSNLMGMSQTLAENYKILLFIGEAALMNPLSLLAVIGVSLLAGAIAYILISGSYIRIVTNRTGLRKAVYKEKKLKRSSTVLALAKKDIRRFFSSPIYILNGALGLIMAVALGVLAVINMDMVDLIASQLGLSRMAISAIAVAVLTFTVAMTIISACSLSIEGKGFWIMKSMPIDGREALVSKALMQFIICMPPVFVATLLLMIAISPSFWWWIVFIITSQLYNAFFAITGILINLMLPKFSYENDAQAVKQSLSTLVYMLTGVVVSTGLTIGLFFVSFYSAYLALLILVGAPAVLLTAEVILLLGPAAKRYEALNL